MCPHDKTLSRWAAGSKLNESHEEKGMFAAKPGGIRSVKAEWIKRTIAKRKERKELVSQYNGNLCSNVAHETENQKQGKKPAITSL